jgi:hypothetical protein
LRNERVGTSRLTSAQSSGLDFAPVVNYGTGGVLAVSVAVADVNRDGKPDIVAVNESPAKVSVFLGNGDGTFQAAATYDSGSESISVAIADVNGDGNPDLIVANLISGSGPEGGSVSVLLGNGDGSFQKPVAYDSGGFEAISVVVADFNGDGKPDIAVANQCAQDQVPFCNNSNVGVLLGNGDGTFQAAVTYVPSPNSLFAISLAVADINGDGKPDIVVLYSGCDAHSCSGGGAFMLIGNGDGTFQAPGQDYASGGIQASSLAVADVNADGKLDLLIANYQSASVGVLLGNGDGSFQGAVTYDSGGNSASSIAAADLNGDGILDIVLADSFGNTTAVLLGSGDGTFQTAVTYSSGGYNATSVAMADLNGDGKPDIVVTNECANSTNCQAGNTSNEGTIGVLINTSRNVTTVALVSSQNPSNFGQPVTFTASVTEQKGFFKGTAAGTVSFNDGTTNIGNSNLNGSGVATLTLSTLKVGTHSITATYNGDANSLPSTSPVLSQLVQEAIVALSSNSLNFGNETVNFKSSPQSVTLTNSGNIPLSLSIGITGMNAANFAQTNTCGTSVSAGGNCTITVTFTPNAVGTKSAAVSITDNAPGSPQKISLSGVGVVPAVTFSPSSLAFPDQVVFTTSKTRTSTLTNSGPGILKITKIAVTGPFKQTNTCGTTVAAGGTCTFTVAFDPTTIGTLTGFVAINDNAPASPQKLSLTGIGTYVQLTPTSLNFGNQPVGTRSLAKRITLSNKGSVAVSITSISTTGANAADFAQTNTCGNSVAAGASCFINVTFKPSATGKRTAAVSVSDNGGGSPQRVGLTGTGTP